MNHAIAIARKDWLLLLRQRSALFFVVGWPLVVAVFFGLVFGGGSGTARPQVAVVDLDGGPAAQALAADLAALAEIDVRPMNAVDAEAAVRRGQRVAAVVIPQGHQQRAAKLFSPDGPQVEVWIDPSRRAETAMLQGLLMQVGGRGMQRQMNDASLRADWLAQARTDAAQWAGANQAQALQFFEALDTFMATQPVAAPGGTAAAGDGAADFTPMRVTTRDVTRQRRGPPNSFAVSFVQGMFWSAFGCLMTFATGLVTERTQGTWSRLRVSPVGVGALLFGKALGCFSAMLLVSALLLLIGRFVFDVPIASVAGIVLAMVASAACFTGLMMLLSTLGDNDRAVSGLSFAVLMPLAMLGGAMVPSFAMPAWVQSVSVISPVRWSVLGFEGATWRGFSIEELLPAVAVQFAVGAAAFGLGVLALRRTARTAA